MGGVRARKSRRNKVVNKTRQKRTKKTPSIASEVVRRNWDASMTVKQNLKTMGIAFDPNNAVRKEASRENHQSKNQNNDFDMQLDDKITDVVKAFEQQAAKTSKKERHIAPGEAKFLLSLSKDYGTDYKSMAKDKRNHNQHTPKQLERKCEAFFKSSYYNKYTQDERMEEES